MNKRRVLILFAHPSQERSEVNVPLFKRSSNHADVTLVDLYAEYPDLDIDIDREQQRLLDHDVIVFMFPLYWYSTPAILKEWQDLVLEYGFAYGHEGTALHGKYFLCAITAGGPEDAYSHDGFNHFTLNELLAPLNQTAVLTGMHFLPPYALYGSRSALEEERIPAHLDQWEEALQLLSAGDIDALKATDKVSLNTYLDSLMGPAS